MVDKIKVKAKKEFCQYRNKVLGLKKKEFRYLQTGRAAEISRLFFKKYSYLFEEIKNGD